MRRLTIAEKRLAAVYKLAGFAPESMIPDAFKKASKAMNAFYRLCGLCERALYIDNDSRLYTESRSEAINNRVEESRKRVDGYLKIFGCHCVWCGYLPRVEFIDKPGSGDAVPTYFY